MIIHNTYNYFTFLVSIFIFASWFLVGKTLSSGDFPYLYLENIKEFSFIPDPRNLWLAPYHQVSSKIFVEYLGMSWELAEKLIWFWPFLIISFLSSWYFSKKILPENFFRFLTPFIFILNTYILMLVGGGQMGIALAYSIVPFVLGRFINLIDKLVLRSKNIKYEIVTGLTLSILTMFDPRVSYATMIAIVLYAVFNIQFTKETKRYTLNTILYIFLIPLAITFVTNSYWIIPLFVGGIPAEHKGLENVAGFEFLSFADFSNAISLLHPNWPENIFGKTYFMKPEFIILPIVAYSSLLFKSSRTILFFALLGLVGAFLAKGVREPFGFLNQWLFEYIPGMSMFRDPSKFYLLISLSYSVLIPFSLFSLTTWLNEKIKVKNEKLHIKIKKEYFIFTLSFLFFIFYFLFLIRPAILGQLTGTFKTHQIPQEYIILKEFLKDDLSFGKVLWIPQRQRFGFYSNNHPVLEASDKNVISILKQEKVKYIIVPFDSQKELFIEDRKYSESLRDKIEKKLDKLPNLVKKKGFGRITVYEVQ